MKSILIFSYFQSITQYKTIRYLIFEDGTVFEFEGSAGLLKRTLQIYSQEYQRLVKFPEKDSREFSQYIDTALWNEWKIPMPYQIYRLYDFYRSDEFMKRSFLSFQASILIKINPDEELLETYLGSAF
jgi:hypothetical protein